jgi:CubicO group peptidase (beta-lactamase class C family)
MPRGDRRWTVARAALGVILLLASSTLFAGNKEVSNPLPAQGLSANQSALTVEDLSAFLEPALNMQRALFGIPGAAVAVVQGGKTLYLGGFGKANLASNEPVSAQETLFRTGSISKLVTWTAVMQLIEQGKFDLHTDVNQYLDTFQIPATHPAPITLAHLMTHTAGFEDRGFGFYARSKADLMPLDTFLASRMPARIFAPGKVSAYSNYGAALAGYLVEQVSGLPFEDYVEAQVLAPLGMSASSFRQPLPPALAARLATGYRSSLEPGAFEWDLAVPAGAMSSTAADMARLMIAHLNGGRLGTTRILRAETVEAMQRRQFSNHPAVSGLTYGFQELHIAGQHILAQPGDMLHFTAALFLLPGQDLGLFVAYNRGRGTGAPMELLRAFLARFFLAPPAFYPNPTQVSDGDVSRFAGSYRSTRRNETTLEKLQELFLPVRVRELGPGTLGISGLAVVPESRWVQIEPDIFRDQFSSEIIAFREDGSGRVTHLFEGNFPTAGYTRLPWYGAPEVHYALLAIGAPLFLLTPIAWTLSALRRPAAAARIAGLARWTAGAMCLVNLLFLAGMLMVIARGRELLFGITPFARAVLVLPVVSAMLTIPTLVLALIVLRQRYWGLASRLHYLLVAVAGLAFLGSVHYWNLLGLRF